MANLVASIELREFGLEVFAVQDEWEHRVIESSALKDQFFSPLHWSRTLNGRSRALLKSSTRHRNEIAVETDSTSSWCDRLLPIPLLPLISLGNGAEGFHCPHRSHEKGEF
jgi:hypothetical protein